MKELRVSPLRKAIARNLTEGAALPYASCDTAIDATSILPFVKMHDLKIDAIFLSAISEIVYSKMPQMNVRWIDGETDPNGKTITDPKMLQYDTLNIGLAMESKNGLVVVTIKDVERKNLWQLNSEIKELTAVATAGKLTLRHFEPKPNIVFNNIGVYPNIINGSPLLLPWNTFMISAFRVVETPVVYKGMIVIRPMMNVKITFDHRPLDGKDPAIFLNFLKENVENFR